MNVLMGICLSYHDPNKLIICALKSMEWFFFCTDIGVELYLVSSSIVIAATLSLLNTCMSIE